MLSSPRLTLVEKVAAQVLRDYEIARLPVCPIEIAQSNDIAVEGMSSGQPGCSGMLLRNGDNFGILYSTDVKNDGFQRFSVLMSLGTTFCRSIPKMCCSTGGTYRRQVSVRVIHTNVKPISSLQHY